MAKVEFQRTNEGEPYEFLGTVQEGGTATQHRVTLRQAGDERLSGGRSIQTWQVGENLPGRQAGGAGQGVVPLSPEREPRESILRAFDLTVISRTFPAYEREIGGRL